ncbi:MAG: helicase-exonuclease AddAB subunit AddA [Lactobacillaceae bacterium]|nr:helicase-exonuclease AddAB subunit AddA [Lactobacillaceae bacterium]
MAMQFTDTQQQAISNHGKNILVSASAGSGKTRVLVERVLQRLLAGENIDKFLIVTFTEAAASEMKERLETAIRGQLNVPDIENQQRQHLLLQLRLINVANISTLHAFALRLIEQYHYAIDLDPVFRLIADAAEKQLLMLEVFDDVLEQSYYTDQAGQFVEFAQQFITDGGNDTGLQRTVFRLFEMAMARPDTDEWLDHLAAIYQMDGDFSQTEYYQNKMRPNIQTALQSVIDQANELLDTTPGEMAERLDDMQTDVARFQTIQEALTTETNWNDLRQLVNGVVATPWRGKLGVPRGSDELVKIEWQAVSERRKAYHDLFGKLKDQYFTLDNAGLAKAISGSYVVVEQLVALVHKFDAAYMATKVSRRAFDFNDLEHFALAIVQQPTIAEKLQAQYSEVMVDEYQDTNYLQEAILSAIAKDNNVFQVGDIKQSIYKFRQAEPKLFGNKLTDLYPNDPKSEVIILAENFRSQPNVTNFINYLFMQLMSQGLGDVEYAGDAKLVAGANYYPAELPKRADLLVYLSGVATEDDDATDFELANAQGLTKSAGQITLMGQKIKELIATEFPIFDRKQSELRPIRYDDITILVSSRTLNLELVDIFKQMEIPLTVSGVANYFQTTEISIMMSLLQIIDNPHQDIPLAAVLRSPMYGVKENGLALIRAQHSEGDFYTAMQALAQQPLTVSVPGVSVDLVTQTITAVQRLEQDLAKFRELAVQNQIVTLIWQIYNQTGWLDYVGGLPSGAQRQANLHALYERAASYQKSSFVGLYQFINYVQELQKLDADLGEADANVANNTVHMMTIHGSKGLEFPVVFMLNTTGKFNTQDMNGAVLLDSQAGIGLKYTDFTHHLELTTPQHATVKDAMNRSMFAEQLRVLYVALTRAEQQLFMVGTYKDAQTIANKWGLVNQASSEWMLPESIRLQGHSFMDLVGMALTRHPQFEQFLNALGQYDDTLDFGELRPISPATYQKKNYATGELEQLAGDFEFTIEFVDAKQLQANMTKPDEHQAQPVAPTEPLPSKQAWQHILQFDYDYATATRATAYQSVSEIKRLFEDPDLQAGRDVVDTRLRVGDASGLRYTNSQLAEPKFMQTAATKISSSVIGTATHLVMQKVDVTKGTPDELAILALINELVQEELIEAAVAPLIGVKKIVQFFTATPLGRQMLQNADSVQREVPFSMLMQADTLYQGFVGDDRVLIHGIIDGYFNVGDETWLFDYKTDHVQAQTAATDLKARYASQINVYAQALIAMGHANVRRFIYAFNTGQIIEL